MIVDPPQLPVTTPPGWYFDTVNRRRRWWDGIQWAFFGDDAAAPTPTGAATNSSATTSLVLGILAMVTPTVFLFAILAVVFGLFGYARSRLIHDLGRGRAIAGLVLGSVSFVFGLVLNAL